MNELAKSQSSISTRTDYRLRTVKRKWELSYGNEDKFYLSEKEKEEFLKQILMGKDVIVINNMILTRFFKYLVLSYSENDNVIHL